MTERNYTAVKVIIQPMNSELFAGIFNLLEVEGIEENENGLIAYFKDFDSQKEDQLKDFFDRMKRELLIEDYSYTLDTIEQKNWNEEWEKTVEPIKVSDTFVIKPSFKEYVQKENEIVLTIDPKMSFGTGYHQSTRLMIRLIEKYIKPGMRVLDVGTGTGVLAIVCAKLGASKVIAVENDEVCTENANENFERNMVTDKCKFVLGEIKDVVEKDFNLIAANINRHILLDIAFDIKERLNKNGLIILSGIIEQDEEIILEKYNSLGFNLIEKISEDEWLGLVFIN